MARHAKPEPEDDGRHFEDLKPEEKAAAFDASFSDPRGYAQRHFGAGDQGDIDDAVRRQGYDLGNS